jgi:hypothetical protein
MTGNTGTDPMPRKYEGSSKDKAEDARGAKKLGVGLRAYERTARDKREDTKGQQKLTKGRRR